jgi:hypothetical protein
VATVFCRFIGCWKLFFGRLMGSHPSAQEADPGGEVELEDIDQLTGLFSCDPAGILGVCEVDSHCPGNCCGGNILPTTTPLVYVIYLPL